MLQILATYDTLVNRSMAWVVLSYSLPSSARSSPRVAVWRRLRALGAISPKAGVHVLPARDECLEAFQWLAQEVEHAKGDALLLRVERFEGLTDAKLIALFQTARTSEFTVLNRQAAALEKSLTMKRNRGLADHGRARELLARLRRRHAEIARIDFFGSRAGVELAARLARIGTVLATGGGAEAPVPAARIAAYRTKRWVTRPHPHVDRLACAWLIRRFINARAQIRYATTPESGEVTFDMRGAEFGHRGRLCTFETMVRAFGLDDPGIRAITEIVHEIDLRDGRLMPPEVSGVDTILKGWTTTYTDAELESHGIALFEGLYATLSQIRGSKPRKRL